MEKISALKNVATLEEKPLLAREDLEAIIELSPSALVEKINSFRAAGKLKEFLNQALGNTSCRAVISYWEKWLDKNTQKMVDEIIAEKNRAYEEKNGSDPESLPLHLEKKFPEKVLKMIFTNVHSIQLTFGCSKGCALCGFDAIPGIREHIPYHQLVNLFQKYATELEKGRPLLYYASEPSDYSSEGKTYADVHQLAKEYAGYNPHITSNHKEEEWLKFINEQKNGSRVSVYGIKNEKIEKIKTNFENLKVAGQGKKHQKGVGVTNNGKKRAHGLESSNGLVLTPRGLYNSVLLPNSRVNREFPQGHLMVPFNRMGTDAIVPGQTLKKILRTAFALNGFYDDSDGGNTFRYLNLNNPWPGTVDLIGLKPRRRLDICAADGFYKLWHDENGIVQRVEETSQDEIFEEYKLLEKHNQKIKELQKQKAEIFDNLGEHFRQTVETNKIVFHGIDEKEKTELLKEFIDPENFKSDTEERKKELEEEKKYLDVNSQDAEDLSFNWAFTWGKSIVEFSHDLATGKDLLKVYSKDQFEQKKKDRTTANFDLVKNGNKIKELAIQKGLLDFYTNFSAQEKESVLKELLAFDVSTSKENQTDNHFSHLGIGGDILIVSKIPLSVGRVDIVLFTDKRRRTARMLVV